MREIWFEAHDPSIVEQDIGLGKIANNARRKGGDLGRIIDVERQHVDPLATTGGFVQGLGAATSNYNGVVTIMEPMGQGFTDAGAPAGDQDRVATEFMDKFSLGAMA